MKRKQLFARIGLWILILMLLGAGAFVIWGSTPSRPAEDAVAALDSGGGVAVHTERWLVFQPDQPASTGLIFYPGGRVAPAAYAPLARAIAANGFLVVIVPMPLNLAVFGIERADEVMAAYPDITSWAIGGHSLGGAMAAAYTYKHTIIRGLALWAAYPAQSNDLSGRDDLAVISISATLDGLATGDKIDTSRVLLPADTQWVIVEGGNHAQFGSYGAQKGDRIASIPASAQHAQIVASMHQFLAELQ